MRTPEALELIRANPCAFLLAYIIAYRGQYRIGFNQHNLELGESLLGDFKSYGMSERQYRTAKTLLAKFRFATFKTTNKGTIGKLIDTRLFSIFRLPSDGQKDTQATDRRRTTDGQPTTTKNIRAEEREDPKGDAPRKRALTATERISAEKERVELAQKMKTIMNRGRDTPFGVKHSKVQIASWRELKLRDDGLKEALKVEL